MATKILINLNNKNHERMRNQVKRLGTTNEIFLNKILDKALREKELVDTLACAPAKKRGRKPGSKKVA